MKKDLIRSLLTDTDWEVDCNWSHCIVRSNVKVYSDGSVSYGGMVIPLRWHDRRCIRNAVRRRLEKIVAVELSACCTKPKKRSCK